MAALIVNISIVLLELYALSALRKKGDTVKYYTYLQNLLALAASLCFVICFLTGSVPEWVRGLRYIATCGLAATAFIFFVFLGGGKKVGIQEQDFLPFCPAKWANAILHIACPLLALVSFVGLERTFSPADGIWTALAPLPSLVYWAVYIILSCTQKWTEPYDLSADGKGRAALAYIALPLSFILISFVLWNIKG